MSDKSHKQHALEYAARGWRVLPVHEIGPDGTCSCAEGAACGRPGKHPRVPEGVKEATIERITIESWWTRWPNASIGIATGRASNLTVVDADASDGKPGVSNLTTISVPHGGIPNTLAVNTGGGGIHLYFPHDPALPNGSNVLAEAIDVRNDGGYVIAPPSLHKSGKKYELRNGHELRPLPEWMLALLNQPAATRRGRRGRPRKNPGFKIEKVESMLAVLDSEDRDRWLSIGTILGRLYVGSGLENDAWSLYETWAARSSKFDEDRAGNLARMREMFYEVSQAEPRAGASPLTVGSIITWAKEAGWSPVGDRVPVDYEPGNENHMASQLTDAVAEHPDNRHFNVMGEVRDVLRTTRPVVQHLLQAHDSGAEQPEALIVRKTSTVGMLGTMTERAALKTTDRHGAPILVPIPIQLAAIALENHPNKFPPLAGVTEWPMVGADGELIMLPRGYDPSTGLYFLIDPGTTIDEAMSAEAAWAALRDDLLVDFPFESDLHQAGALSMLLCFMQRPLMKTCPGFAVNAPQPNTGKSTLVEVASLAVHGVIPAAHAWTFESEELRKAIHAMLRMKLAAVLFDNITKGAAVDSDHLSKLLTSEENTDRTLGASETRKELNKLLVTFTGNNISFVRDLASRVITLQLNAKSADPLKRNFKHWGIKDYARKHRSRWLSALVAVARAGVGHNLTGAFSRFEDFDRMIAAPVQAVTGQDVRSLLDNETEVDTDDDNAARAMLELLWNWQQQWRSETMNKEPWTTADVVHAAAAGAFDSNATNMGVLHRGCGGEKNWTSNPTRALGYALRALKNNYSFTPMMLTSVPSKKHGDGVKWLITGGPTRDESHGTF